MEKNDTDYKMDKNEVALILGFYSDKKQTKV